jgi:polyphosphate kinase 2 (PPK2 family)
LFRIPSQGKDGRETGQPERENAVPELTPIERAKQQVEQAKARYQALLARQNAEERKLDTRRKVILGGLLIDAAGKDERFGRVIDELMKRITRDHDHKAFEGWQKPEPDKS